MDGSCTRDRVAGSKGPGGIMCEPDRLWQAITSRAAQHQFNRGVQVREVPYGDKYRLDACPRAYDGSDHLAAIHQIDVSAAFVGRLDIFADEQRFAAANGRPLKPKAHVCRDTDSTWMGASHSIENEHVRFMLQA